MLTLCLFFGERIFFFYKENLNSTWLIIFAGTMTGFAIPRR
jgi:hypothetical protein